MLLMLVLLLLLLLLLYQLFPTLVPWRCHVLMCLMRSLMHWPAGSTGSASGTARVNRGQWPNTSTRTELECFMQIPMCWHTGSAGSVPTARINRERPESIGAGGLTPLLQIHGIPFNTLVFDPLFARFAAYHLRLSACVFSRFAVYHLHIYARPSRFATN